MRKVRIVSAMLVIILGVTGCGRISKLTDKKSEQEKVRVIQNERSYLWQSIPDIRRGM